MNSDLGPDPRTVALLLDPESHAQVLALADSVHVWVIESASNRAAAEEVWQRRVTKKSELSMTVFQGGDVRDPEAVVAAKLAVLDLHHGEVSQMPPWNRLEVHGARPTVAILEALSEFGFVRVQETANGFEAWRSPDEAD